MKTIGYNSQKIFWVSSYTFYIVISLFMFSPFFFHFDAEKMASNKTVKRGIRQIKLDTNSSTIQDTCIVQRNRVTWSDYKNRNYEGTFEICETDYLKASKNREQTFPADYMKMIRFDTPHMQRIYKMFYDIAEENDLDYTETAEMIVSCVQNIPYTLVITSTKESFLKYLIATHQQDSFAYKYILEGNPVLESVITFGVQSPTEFSYNLKGDCDTRTTWLYTVLKKFNYDVVILNSDIQNHSILGINIPYATGNNFFLDRRNNKKYYVWETTVPGFPIGIFPNFVEREWYVATII